MKTNKRQTIAKLSSHHSGQSIKVAGWVRTARILKSVVFIELYDGTTPDTLQLVLEKKAEYHQSIPRLLTGASIEAEGILQLTPRAAQPFELLLDCLKIIGEAPEYPLQKKEHSAEFLRTIPHLRARTSLYASVFRLRSMLSGQIRSFFHHRGFVEVHTPIISTHDAEGAGALFQVHANTKDAFFGAPSFLTVSGQLNAECAACALDKVYTFAPTFRAENSHTTRHLSEFWMVEPEMAWCNLADARKVAQDMLAWVAQALFTNASPELALLQKKSPGIAQRLTTLTHLPYAVLEYQEAIRLLQSAQSGFEYAPKWGIDLQSEHQQWLVRYNNGHPLFVVNWPTEIKPFYMRLNDDRTTVASMDLLLPSVGEVIGGSQREERYDFLLRALEQKKIPPQNYDWYLDLRRYGTVPHSGFGLGFDRLLLYITGISNVRDVVPFPRTPGNAYC